MILAGSKQLDGMLRDGSFPRLLLLWGEDGPAVQKYQRRLEKAVLVRAEYLFVGQRVQGAAPDPHPPEKPQRLIPAIRGNKQVIVGNDRQQIEDALQLSQPAFRVRDHPLGQMAARNGQS